MGNNTAIKVENLSKQYRLGEVGTGTISHDLNRWWHRIRGKEDPYLRVGESNDRTNKGNSDYVWALQDINFEVQQGEVLGVIGKNGAGKSTLLKILSKVTAPTTGLIKAKGRIASLLEVGTGFHPELTGRENIYLNGTILGMTKREVSAKLDEIVDFAGVERYLDTPVKRYSSGMMVRLGFAVAAHLEPEILIVDEVLAVGDAEFQKKAIGKMQKVSQGQGRTVLFVSHSMAAVLSLCSRSVLLSNGALSFLGNTETAIQKYLDLRTRASSYAEEIPLNELVRIKSFEIEPYSIRKNESLGFKLHIYLGKGGGLSELAILIQNEMNVRVAIIDLRMLDFSSRIQNDEYYIEGEIKNINLMEGFYNVGIHIKSTFFWGDKYDLVGFELLPDGEEFSNHGKEYRGYIELDYIALT